MILHSKKRKKRKKEKLTSEILDQVAAVNRWVGDARCIYLLDNRRTFPAKHIIENEINVNS